MLIRFLAIILKKKMIRFLNKRKRIIFVIVVVMVFIMVWSAANSESEVELGEVIENETGWNTYVNKEYGFKIDFPRDWKLFEDFERLSPIINIYKSRFDSKPPYDHFSNINVVAIFPRGVETEVLIGETVISEIEIDANTDSILDYVLSDDQVWATYITFLDLESPWKSWGSVWARAEIIDVEFACENNGKPVLIEECNPFEGDQFVRSGEVNQEIVNIQKEILESFSFLE